jgi:hypothetical protein
MRACSVSSSTFCLEQRASLGHAADPLLYTNGTFRKGKPGNGDAAAIGCQDAGDQLDGCALAAPFGPRSPITSPLCSRNEI